jgi:hypothetical protein
VTLAVSSKINEKIIDEVCIMMAIFVSELWTYVSALTGAFNQPPFTTQSIWLGNLPNALL